MACTYSIELAETICRRIAAGESLLKITRDPAMPSRKGIASWRKRYPEFERMVREARQEAEKPTSRSAVSTSSQPANVHQTASEGEPTVNSKENPMTKTKTWAEAEKIPAAFKIPPMPPRRGQQIEMMRLAYNEVPMIERMRTSQSERVRAIGDGLFDSAAAWAALRHLVAKGQIPAEYDITDELMDAAADLAINPKLDKLPSLLRDCTHRSEVYSRITRYVIAVMSGDLATA